jgi:DNA polymerase III alpha subunit
MFAVYVELHAHSAFSFLDGASLPDELAGAAAELGYRALALTDHNGVFGSMEHAQACRALGVRALHGAEVDVTDPHGVRHLTLLVESQRGWSNLCRLLTRAHAHTRAPDGGRVIIPPSVPLEAVLARAEGLVCLSGCARQGVRDEPTLRRLLDAFGPERFRVELQRPFLRHDRTLNRGLEAMARQLGVPCVATGNVHAHSRERALLQDAFVAIREHATLDASEPLRRGNHAHVLASPRAMASRFADHPDAVRETVRLAERLTFDLDSDLGYRYPGAEDAEADRELAELCADRFDTRYPPGHRCRDEARGRLEEELRVIRTLGLSGFFILHWELLELAREVAAEVRGPDTVRALLPPGRGRGSSVSSIVCYLTGLSHIDPVENELFLGRFLNEELTSLPDIDLDFPRDVREKLIPLVHERYGAEKSALVAAFPTYRSRGAIREVGKALGLPPGEIERVARVAEPWAQSVEEDVNLALGAAAEAAEGTHSAKAAAGSSAARRPTHAELGPSPPGPAPWTAQAGVAARAAMGVATSREGGPDPAVNQPLAAAAGHDRPGHFHDAYGDTRSREARAQREAATRASAAAQTFARDRAAERADVHRDGDARNLSWAPEVGASAAADSGRLQGRWGWLSRLAGEAYGLPRHLSQHPGGMIVATRPLIDCVPLVPAAMAGRQMCHWDKDSCADAGFLKIDLLGLGMLSAVERAVEEIARTRRERIDLSRIPYDDKPTYAAIQRADTMGVFQIESRAQMQSLLRTQPETLDDITVQVAIVRPGPIVGGAVNPYIDRKQKLRANPDFEIPYDHPSLEPVLKDTLGTIIFQDQVLEVAMAFAGFSPGEAEGLRRAMSRKRSAAAIERYHERFVTGAAKTHGADRETAERVFTMIAGFSGFGFPKAHGAAFGLLAYQSTWLRVHYKPEFTCALLNEQPMGFYPSDTLIHECQRTGIEVIPPDVNHAKVLCHVEELGERPRIRIGLGYLNGARADEVAAIVAEREARGPYRSLGELASRAGAGRPALAVLAWSGACDSLIGGATEQARRTALWQLGIAAPAQRAAAGDQLALPLELPDAPPLKPLQAWERMVADYATTGLTAGGHPMALVREDLPGDVVTSADLERLRHNTRVRIGGLVVARQRPATAHGIVFMLLEDEHGTINLVVPPTTYDRDRLVVRGEPLVFAEGRLEKHPKAAGAINVVVDSLRPLDTSRIGPAADVIPMLVSDPSAPDALADADPPEPWVPAAAAAGGRDFAAVAPPVQSFAQGRRR